MTAKIALVLSWLACYALIVYAFGRACGFKR